MAIGRTAAAVVLAAAHLGAAGSAEAEGPGGAPAAGDAAAELRARLEEYDRQGGGNTIPIEQAILSLRDRGEAAALAEFLGHPRFGATVLWALCEAGRPGFEERILAAYAAMSPQDQAEAALSVGSLRTPKARLAIRAAADREAKDPGFPGAREALRAGLVRGGDAATLEILREDLASGDPDRAAGALLLAGDARAAEFLPDAARLAADARPLARPVSSAFAEETTTRSPDGTVTMTSTHPERKTLGAAALEAANRMVRPTTPGFIGWWYEMEKAPRFGFDAKAPERLRAWVAAEAKAAKAKAPGAAQALAALEKHLRAAGRGEATLAVVSASFDGKWTLEYTLDGGRASAVVEGATVSTRIPAPKGE